MTAPERLELFDGVQLVAASAGTGKTHRITSLAVLGVAQRAIPIERILIVTFTRNATAELKERVRARLRAARRALQNPAGIPQDDDVLLDLPDRAAAAADGAEWPRRLRRALLDFDAASISTIHGFCQRSLGQNALATGTEPEMSFAGDVKPALEAIARDSWISNTWDLDGELLAQLTHKNYPFRFKTSVLVTIGEQRLHAPGATLRPPQGPLVLPDVATQRAAAATFKAAWDAGRAALLAKLKAASGGFKKSHNDAAELDRVAAAVDALLAPYALFAAVHKKTHRKLTSRAILDARLAATKARPKLDDAAVTIPLTDQLESFLDGHEAFEKQLDAYGQALRRRFADEVVERLEGRRQRRHVQNYGDLLVGLADAVRDGSPLAGELRGTLRTQYEAALIDEFQDTDPVQWTIFSSVFVAPDLPLVLVGDDKQAIYSFRGADVHAYRAASKVAADTPSLDLNQRSDERLVGAVNHLFDRPSPAVKDPFLDDQISFTPVRSRHPRRITFATNADRAPLQLRFLRRDDPDSVDPMKAPAARGRTAEWLARDIEALIAEAPTLRLGDLSRPLRADDIAVLVRTHLHGTVAQEALTARGIPSVRHSQDDVLRSPMAAQLRRVLAALLAPRKRKLVGAALVTSIVGRSSEDLALLQRDEAAWEAETGRLRRWAGKWRDSGIGAALRTAFDELEVVQRLLAEDVGGRSVVDLRHIAELLHAAERAEHLQPAALLRWLEDALAGAKKADAEADGPDDRLLNLETDAHAVQIVTIHASKGLQYPVVFCTSLWDSKGAGNAAALRYHEGDSTILDLDPKRPRGPGSGAAQAQAEAASEEMRLAYVALTRARHRCVVYWGAFGSFGGSALAWLLHQRAGATGPEAQRALASRLKGGSDETLIDELNEVAAGAPEGIEVVASAGVPPAPTAGSVRPAPPAPFAPCGRRFLDTWWRVSSFTGLAGDATETPSAAEEPVQPEAEGINRDPEDEEPRPRFWEREELDPSRCLPLTLVLKPGKTAGNALHAILEHHDFRKPAELSTRVVVSLKAHGFDADADAARVVEGLELALATPLPGARIPLNQLSPEDRLNELEFHLRLGSGANGKGIRKEEIAAVLKKHPTDELPERYHERFGRASFRPLSGLLKGSIDLVFRHKERWYLADYKSSWLGFEASDYGAEGMTRPMESHDYYLQYLLYSAALHLFLQQRLTDYKFADHFGGAYYLFLRGMTPDGPPGTGVFYDPLNVDLVDGLAKLLTGRGGSS